MKAAVCAVLRVALRVAVQQRSARRYQETTAIASLQTLVQSLQIRTVDLQRNLEEKKVQNDTTSLWQVLGHVLARYSAGVGAAGPRASSPGAADPIAAGAGATAALPIEVMAGAVTLSESGREPGLS